MYIAIVSIEMCLSIDDINKRDDEHKIARKVVIVYGYSADGSTATFVRMY